MVVSEPQEEGQSPTNTNVGAEERLDKDRSYENSVDNMNVGNEEMLDKDYENSGFSWGGGGGGGGGLGAESQEVIMNC